MSNQLIRRIDRNTGRAEYHTLHEWNVINGYEPADPEPLPVLRGEVLTTPEEVARAHSQAQPVRQYATRAQPSHTHSTIGEAIRRGCSVADVLKGR